MKGVILLVCIAAAVIAVSASASIFEPTSFPDNFNILPGTPASKVGYPDTKLPHGNTTVIATALTPTHVHAFAVGEDVRYLWHKYQNISQGLNSKWTDWILRAVAPKNGTADGHWWGDPAVGVAADGTVHVFQRYLENLDTWLMVQTEPGNPEAWSQFKEGHCTQACTVQSGCIAGGCTPECLGCLVPVVDNYFNTQLVFPTNNMYVQQNTTDGRIIVYYRGFDGSMYMITQRNVFSHYYTPPFRLCSYDDETCLVV